MSRAIFWPGRVWFQAASAVSTNTMQSPASTAQSPPPAIQFSNVVKSYADATPAVNDVSFTVASGELAVILGPSGCGKTTLLKMVNRLQEPTAGTIFVNGRDTNSVEATALRRGIGYVIQQIGLFPHMTVAQNVAVVPQLLGWAPARTQARVQELLELVRLPFAEYGSRYPSELSGGQQQRVGLARALGADPDILLMDEPFGALDAIERTRLQTELATLHRHLRKTILFVTHDVDEALRLADRIVIMRAGQVVQAARPLEILAAPADRFVDELMNTHDLVRRMSVLRARDAMLAGGAPADGLQSPVINADSDLRSAFSDLLLSGSDTAAVVEASHVIGRLTIESVLQAARLLHVSG